MLKILLLAFSGALGTLARYGLSGLISRYTYSMFPYGTVIVNMLGCFLFGIIWVFTENKIQISGEVRSIILVGFMGAFTTFSTFMFETGRMIQDGELLYAGENLLLENLIGLTALFVGIAIGRIFS